MAFEKRTITIRLELCIGSLRCHKGYSPVFPHSGKSDTFHLRLSFTCQQPTTSYSACRLPYDLVRITNWSNLDLNALQAGLTFDTASSKLGRTAEDMRAEMAMLVGNQAPVDNAKYGYRPTDPSQYHKVRCLLSLSLFSTLYYVRIIYEIICPILCFCLAKSDYLQQIYPIC